MTLPRGTTGQLEHAPAATARWMNADEIKAFAYRPGDIFLGATDAPSPEAELVLADLARIEAMIAAIPDINPAWRDPNFAVLRQHRIALMKTDSMPIGTRDDRHVTTMAASRAGKGVSSIIPTLLHWPGSTVVIDPKNEAAALTSAHRAKGIGQSCAVLAPYGATDIDESLIGAWNPLDGLNEHTSNVVDVIATYAAALVIASSTGDSVHFDESAKQLIEALIAFVVLNYEGDEKSLLTVHRLLFHGAKDELHKDFGGELPADAPSPMLYLFELMRQEERLEGLVAAGGANLADMPEKERGSILSTARRNFAWLNRPAMRCVVARSTFDMKALKDNPKGLSLYLSLPPARMGDCERWLRLVITAAIESCYASLAPPTNGHPVLFLLDEFNTLGHLQVLETAAGYAAGFGIKFWFILQDLGQLKRHYKDAWETFLGNSGVLQGFGNTDQTTLDYLSKRCGEIEISHSVMNTTTSLTASSNNPGEFQKAANLFASRGQMSFFANPLLALTNQNTTGQSAATTTAMNQQITRGPLIQSDEIMRIFRRDAMMQLVSIAGKFPMAINRTSYFSDPDFMALYQPVGRARSVAEARAEKQKRLQDQATKNAKTIEDARAFVRQTQDALESIKM